MMKPSKNIVVLALIVSSIFLLMALQAFWLRSSYENEAADLRKEANSIFKSTVAQLRDSVFFRSVEPGLDSAAVILRGDPISVMGKVVDTVFVENRKSKSVQVLLTAPTENDSLLDLLKPITERLRKRMEHFSIRIGASSLNVDSLKNLLAKNLRAANIDTPVSVEETIGGTYNFGRFTPLSDYPMVDLGEFSILFKPQSLFSDTLFTEPVRISQDKIYSASLIGLRATTIKKLTSQILFSAFLTLITIAAFIVLYRSLKAQQKLMELKNDFISNITHELKTPITTVGVAIEAMKNFKGANNPAASAEYLDIARNELNRLSILTDKILKTAIFENKGVEFKPEPIDMNNLVEQVLASMKLVFEKREAKVTFEKQGDDFSLMGGSVHLTSIVYNLIDNALKYGRVKPEVTLTLNAEPSRIILSVKDNGPGIPTEFQKKIFEKFFRVPTGDVHTVKGYGLGLSYVESVVNAHGGKIDVESGHGKGSNFIITLPK